MVKKILMCPPDFFDIEYEINPWMHQDDQPSDDTAHQQWDRLYDIYTHQMNWNVKLLEPVQGLPDMVFTTDSGLIIGDKVMLSNFRFPERRAESGHYEKWFRQNGYINLHYADNFFEGGGDMLPCGNRVLAGYGFRSALESHDEMRQFFNIDVVSLKLVNPHFYHLDTALAVLSEDTVAFYPEALDEASQQKLREVMPNVIEATLEEARSFGLNAVSDGHTIIASNASESLLQKYRDAGFEVIGTPILEFRKAGGGVKCLTLELR